MDNTMDADEIGDSHTHTKCICKWPFNVIISSILMNLNY